MLGQCLRTENYFFDWIKMLTKRVDVESKYSGLILFLVQGIQPYSFSIYHDALLIQLLFQLQHRGKHYISLANYKHQTGPT